jgi:hypothetical protein
MTTRVGFALRWAHAAQLHKWRLPGTCAAGVIA